MSQIIEEAIVSNLAAWIAANRPVNIPSTVPVLASNRDELRTRPCIVVHLEEFKIVPSLPNTGRGQLKVYLFTQIDDTPVETHGDWSSGLASLLRGKHKIVQDLSSDTFILHDLIWRESSTVPDDSRGRETVLTFEAVASAV